MDASEFARPAHVQAIAPDPGLLDYLAVLWRRRWVVAFLTVLAPVVTALTLAQTPTRYTASALAYAAEGLAARVKVLLPWGGIPDAVLGEATTIRLDAEHGILLVTAEEPAPDVEASLGRFLAWLETERRVLPRAVPLPAPEPEPGAPRFVAEAVAEVPEGLGTRVASRVGWNAVPDLPPGVTLGAEYAAPLLRVSATGRTVEAVQRARERLLAWLGTQQYVPAPHLPPPAAPPRDPAAIARAVTRFTQELAAIEARLPGLAPTAAPYWTSRALSLRQRLDGLEALASPPPPPPPAVPAAPIRPTLVTVLPVRDETPPVRPRPVLAPAPLEREQFEVLRTWPATARPKPWVYRLSVAATAGLIIGGGLALGLEWLARERALREFATLAPPRLGGEQEVEA